MLKVKIISVGDFSANCYIVSLGLDAFIVDPGDDGDELMTYVKSNELNLLFVLNTHGHCDHIGANDSFDSPLFIHKDDESFLNDPNMNLSGIVGRSFKTREASRALTDGDRIEFCDKHIDVIHTPGHTPGSCCFFIEDCLFSGDTLFKETIGRTDLPSGDGRQIMISINSKLKELPDNVRLYPGHGEPSTMGWEKKHNFCFRSTND